MVGGEHARGILDGAPVLYWPELWGTRALLYVWNDSAVIAVTAALHNQAWRVREMAARVAAARGLDVAPILVGMLGDDPAGARSGGQGPRGSGYGRDGGRHPPAAQGPRDRRAPRRAAGNRRDQVALPG